MRFDDLLLMSFRQVLRQRRRSVGVAMAIALGTASLIVMITMGQDIKDSLNKDLELLGNATIVKAFFNSGREKYAVARPMWFRETTANAVRAMPGVMSATRIRLVYGLSIYSADDVRFNLRALVGVDEHFFEVNSFPAIEGRFFGHKEVAGREKVCVLGEELAKWISDPKTIVGQLIRLEGNFYRVTGVIGGLGMGSNDEKAFIPLSTAEDRIGSDAQPDLLYVRCKTWDDVQAVSDALPKVILSHQPADGLDIKVSWKEWEKVRTMAWWIEFLVYLAISATLILGGFGIWNIMMAGVKSRTREIGLKKAIGAEDRDILAQFLTEALCLSLSAAVIGIVFGRILIFFLSAMIDSRPPEDLFLLCVGFSVFFSMILGIGAGLAPSIRASRMEVVYAVRFE